MKHFIAYIQVFISYFYLWPHMLGYIFATKEVKDKIYSDTRCINDKMSVKFTGLQAILYVIQRDPYYRKMFYHRIGVSSFLYSWYFPGESTFDPICHEIDGGVYLAHPSSTYLNAKKIGRNFSCRQNTTIGNKKEGDFNSRPIIGNNVSLGANVCIIGNITIGDNVVVGAGSVVVKDIPANSTVVGNPAKVITKRL